VSESTREHPAHSKNQSPGSGRPHWRPRSGL